MSKPVLIFRADADNQMGTGHLIRSSALAGVLSNDFDCKLITYCSIPSLLEQVHPNFSAIKI
jgi:UDP-2,4-diacetamido-2,4,6-trideoxy-beta-L-altropyranose hydrolase